ncbi:MAG: right-handed parallel beta-helix repeat-containing protein, partial [Terrimicrobiaceae bacterium]
MNAEDSGTAENPVVWSAFEGEKPRLIGGPRISGWKMWKNNIWMCDLTSQNITEISDLYVNGERQVLARYPNLDPSDPVGGGWSYVAGDPVPMYEKRASDSKTSFQTEPGDWRHWARPQEARVFVFPRFNWWNNILNVKDVDPAGRLITTSHEASYALRPGDRYYFEGPIEELDAPREWAYDKGEKRLYFMPDQPLSNADVFVPTTRSVISLRQGVHHVILQNLSIECATGSAVRFEQTAHCRLLDCRIRNIGDYSSTAVVVQEGADNGISHCEISDVGGSGIALSGGDIKTLTPSSHFVESCDIHNVGVRYKQGVGIALSGVGQRVSRCLLHHMPRFAILFGGNNQTIEYNHIHDVVLETEDAGAVYSGSRDWINARGSVIRYNYIHDIPGFGFDGRKWRSSYKAWGIYLDDNAGGVDVTGNIVAKCGEALLHGHSARDCYIENNIFVNGGKYQWEFNGWTASSEMWNK